MTIRHNSGNDPRTRTFISLDDPQPLGSQQMRRQQGDPSPRRIGIIDLGSNTARLVVFECLGDRSYRMIDSIRERVRLAEGINRDGTLNSAAVGRALSAMELFSDYRRAVGLDALEIIATSAVRDATNREEILEPLNAMGLRARVLEEAEEAAFGVAAVANTSSLHDAWVIDQGGGSIQISSMRDRRFADGASFPFGTLRLTEAFLDSPSDALASKDQISALEAHLEQHLGETADRIAKDPAPLVCMGGTIRNLANAVQERADYPLSLLHGYHLERDALEEIAEIILGKSVADRPTIPGLRDDRADVVAAGAITFRWLLRRTGQAGLFISGAGVREGALFQSMLPAPHLVPEVKRFAVGNLFRHYPQPIAHTENVRSLALQLFDQLKPLHGFGDDDRFLLETATVLHDIGMTISYYRHHRHGAFLIQSTGLDGFSHRETALVTLMVQYHRRGIPRRGDLAALLTDPDDQRRLRTLTVCLRLAEHLERSRTGRVQRIAVHIADDLVTFNLEAGVQPTLEIWEANQDAELFELALDRRLEIRCN